MTVARYDFIALRATVDSATGWIRDRPVITRAGVFEYTSKDGKKRRELRPENEVFDEASLGSIQGVPVTKDHVGLLSASNLRGVIGSVLSPGIREDTNVVADVIIHDPSQIGQRRDLSLGYVCELDETPGVTEKGERYDGVQRNIRYNHLAVVHNGRAGNARLRLDSTDAVSGQFDKENEMDMKLVTIKLDGLEYSASPEIGIRMAKYEVDISDLQAKLSAMEADRDLLRSSLASAKEKAEEDAKTALNTAKERVKLENTAESLEVAHSDSASDRDIKVAVVAKLRGEAIKFDGKSDDYVNSAFDLVMAEQGKKEDGVSNQRKQMHTKSDAKDVPESSAQAARARMLARIRGEKEAA